MERRPDDAYARLLLGRTLQRLGRRDDAQPHLRVATVLGVADRGRRPDGASTPVRGGGCHTRVDR